MRKHLIPALLAALILFTGCQAAHSSAPAAGEAPVQAELMDIAISQTPTAEPTLDETEALLTEPAAETIPDEADTICSTEAAEAATAASEALETEAHEPEQATTEAETPPATEAHTEKAPAKENAPAAASCKHSFGPDKTVAATCTENGYSEHSCTRCGYTETYKRTYSTGHTWGAGVVVKPTCTEKGYTVYTCTRCGAASKFDWKDKAPHAWSAWTQTKAPSCNAAGAESRSCTVCGKSETREISKLPHSFTSETVAPSCTEGGYTIKTCSVCGTSEKTDKTSSLGHDFKFTNTVAPTTSAGGYDLYTCSRCGATERRNETDKLEEIADLQAVLQYGLAYAQSLGYTVDPTMTLENSSYYPGYRGSHDTTEFLKARAVGLCQVATDNLIASGINPAGVARCYFHVSYDTVYPGEYYIVFLYG